MISIRKFSGMVPRLGARLLANGQAQVATNTKLWSGELRAYKDRVKITALAKVGDFVQSAYYFNNTNWLHWTEDVDVARSPIAGDTTRKTYFSGTDAPRVTNTALVDILGGNSGVITGATKANPCVITDVAHGLFSGARVTIANIVGMIELNGTTYTVTVLTADTFSLDGIDSTGYTAYVSGGTWTRIQNEWPEDSYLIGVPTPTSKITATPVVATGVITAISKANPGQVTDAAHGLVGGELVKIKNVVGMVEVNDNQYTITVVDANNYTIGVDTSAYTTYTSGGTWAQEYAAADITKTAYVYTYVNDWGEESAPAPVSSIIDVGLKQTIDLTNLGAAPSGDYAPISKWRIYRVNTGNNTAEYQLVAEVTINTNTPQYNDSIAAADLAEVITTTDGALPPTGLKGMLALPNGVMAGFTENELCLSEPYQPHSWPVKYRQSTDYTIIGIGSFGNSVVLATDAFPYVATGVHPLSYTMRKLNEPRACISKRGIISVMGGVMYPCAEGLMFIGPGIFRVITEPLMTRDEWNNNYYPTTIHAEFYNGRYFAFYDTGVVNGVKVGAGFIYDPDDQNANLVDVGFYAHGAYTDPETGKLYLVIDNAGVNEIHEWEGAGTKTDFTWKSKIFSTPEPVNLAAARILADYTAPLADEDAAAFEAQRLADIAINVAFIGKSDGEINAAPVNMYEVNGGKIKYVPPSYTPPDGVLFQLFADGVEKFSKRIRDNLPFRLPKGFRAIDTEIQLSAQVDVQRVDVSPSVEELDG